MKAVEYCMENLGKKDTEYGGVLTDLASLPIGTSFYVCNGIWRGRIVEIDGKRAVKPDGCEASFLDLDKPNNNILALKDIVYPEN